MGTIEELVDSVHREARRAPFPIDTPVYERSNRDPHVPILYAGSLDSPVCVFARDLGKDEVAAGEPLIGAGGRLVRAGVFEARQGSAPPKSDRRLASVLEHVLLTNTVPYKPPGNKAYPASVKERFRQFLVELLATHWKGSHVITLGTEAFQWFAPYAAPGEFEEFWSRERRYEEAIECTLEASAGGKPVRKTLTLLPLPHPSPLNQRWYGQFPGLLAGRLKAIEAATGASGPAAQLTRRSPTEQRVSGESEKHPGFREP